MYGSYRSKKSYHSIRSLDVIANSLLGCKFSCKTYGFNFSNFFKFFNFPICERVFNIYQHAAAKINILDKTTAYCSQKTACGSLKFRHIKITLLSYQAEKRKIMLW